MSMNGRIAGSRLLRAVGSVIEQLEVRQFLSVNPQLAAPAAPLKASSAPAVVKTVSQPSVRFASPANGATGVRSGICGTFCELGPSGDLG